MDPRVLSNTEPAAEGLRGAPMYELQDFRENHADSAAGIQADDTMSEMTDTAFYEDNSERHLNSKKRGINGTGDPLAPANGGNTSALGKDIGIMKGELHNFEEDGYFGSGNVEAMARARDSLVLSMKNIHKTYLLGVEGVPALRGVTMSIRRGEFVIVYGTSGGGKTSLLNIIGTIDKPTKGELWLCGTRITNSTADKELARLRLKKLGFVFQTFNLLSSLTALENVELPMVLAGDLTAAERRTRAQALLSRVGMAKREDHVPSQLSGGEQQRVTIARSIANKPEVLLLDEPTGDLDTRNTTIVLKLLTDLNREEGITLVMVTHDVALKAYADRVIWMRDGRIQRVEKVSQRKKREALARLAEEYERVAGTVGEASDGMGRTGGRPEWKNTEVRKPGDYATHTSRLQHLLEQAAADLASTKKKGKASARKRNEMMDTGERDIAAHASTTYGGEQRKASAITMTDVVVEETRAAGTEKGKERANLYRV